MFPASAGMIPGEFGVEQIVPNVPRKRGDDPAPINPLDTAGQCSPQARG